MKPIQLLMVEDSEDDALLVARELRRGGFDFDLRRVQSAVELEAALDAREWDLVLADFSMPSFSGRAALDLLRARGLDTPFIFVSGTIGEDAAVDAMVAGARDYVMKTDLRRLVPAVRRELQEARSRRERAGLEQQLRHSQRLESLGRLAGGVAHDFNNLLTVILGSCDLLAVRPEVAGSEVPELAAIRDAAESAASLAAQLLTFGRKQSRRPQALDLAAVVERVRGLVTPLLGRSVTLIVEARPGEALTHADPGQVEQVLINLAVNARDAMPRGGTLTIATAAVELDEAAAQRLAGARPGRFAQLTVGDTGTGMDDEVRSHLFEPFFTTKERGRGSGLGLATVHGIVAQSGGFIRVESEPERGSRFDVHFPWRDGEGLRASVEPQAPSVAAAGGGETVLVVDDSDALRMLARRVLERHGYRVLDAPDAEAAVAAAEEHEGPIHLLLSDLSMPGRSGIELARDLAAERPGLRVVFTSGQSSDSALQQGLLEEGTTLLEKPWRAAELLRRVREELDAD